MNGPDFDSRCSPLSVHPERGRQKYQGLQSLLGENSRLLERRADLEGDLRFLPLGSPSLEIEGLGSCRAILFVFRGIFSGRNARSKKIDPSSPGDLSSCPGGCQLRARFLAEVLLQSRFHADRRGDLVTAWLRQYPQKPSGDGLEPLGKLMACARQLDMLMEDESMMRHFVNRSWRKMMRLLRNG